MTAMAGRAMSDDFDPNEFLNAALAADDRARSDRPADARDPFELARKAAAAKAALREGGAAHALVAAARERSPEARGLLVQGLNELCLKSGVTLSESERALVYEIFDTLLETVQTNVRASLADHVADREDAPRDLLIRLARDAIEVAEPVLARSLVLEDEDLVPIVLGEGEGHQLAVTRRRSLSGSLTEALARRDNETVLVAMLSNPGAEVDEEVMIRIAEGAADRPALHGPLAGRKDLSMRVARRLYGVVGPRLKEAIETRLKELEATGGGAEKDSLRAALDEANERFAAREATGFRREDVTESATPSADPDDLADLRAMPSDLGGHRPHPRLLVKALVEGRYEEFESLFGEFAKLSRSGVDRILNRAGPEALAIACKAGGMDKQGFGEVLARVMDQDNPAEAARTPAFRKTITYFDRIDASGAARVLQAWR
nr:DUF2336 domain-containing protein [Marivibrio halodurans]